MPRVAAGDAGDSFERASDRSVLCDGQDEVLAACRMEAALSADDVAQRHLIQPNDRNQQQRRNLHEVVQQTHERLLDCD